MVFTDDQLNTKALEKVKKESRSALFKDIEIHLKQHAEENENVETFYFRESDIKEKFFKHNSRYEISYIKKVLTSEMMLEKKQQRHPAILQDRMSNEQSLKARVFSYKNPYYNESEPMEIAEDDFVF